MLFNHVRYYIYKKSHVQSKSVLPARGEGGCCLRLEIRAKEFASGRSETISRKSESFTENVHYRICACAHLLAANNNSVSAPHNGTIFLAPTEATRDSL